MDVPAKISDERRVNMTSKGQVLLPKAIRDKIGLVPGRPVRVGINERGEAVVLPDREAEGLDARRARIRADLGAISGIWRDRIEGSTDEIMRELRGDDPFPP